MQTPSVHYEYADGNANRYVIADEAVHYIPVTPAQSSTGFYSGGEPALVTITPAQFQSLQKLLEEAIADSTCHSAERPKGTGMILKINPDGMTTRVILQTGTPSIRRIESSLKEIMHR